MANPSSTSTPVLAGDDVGAIVIDIGSNTSRIGYAGEDTPRQLWDSCAGRRVFVPDDCYDELVFPMNFYVKSEGIEVKPCIYNSGKNRFLNEDVFCTIVSMTCEGAGFRKRTEFKKSQNHINDVHCGPLHDDSIPKSGQYSFGSLGIDLKEHPILLSEPTRYSKSLREKMVEVMFEYFGAPATYLVKQAALSAFAVGRSTGLIVDIGASGNCTSQVVDGYVLQNSVMESPVGGDCLDMQFSDLVTSRNHPIYPFFEIKKIWRQTENGQSVFEIVKQNIKKVHPTYIRYGQCEIIRKLREAICRVAEDDIDIKNAQTADFGFIDNSGGTPQGSPPKISASLIQHANSIQYKELPDGTKLEVENYIHRVPEILFKPSLIRGVSSTFLNEFKGVPHSIFRCIQESDVELRRDLLNSIILTGGCSLLPGLSERVSRELQENESSLGSSIRFRIISPSVSVERRFSSWIGGSILASLGAFQQMWISSEEYEEHGIRIVDRKCD